jgi:hypothetical protein
MKPCVHGHFEGPLRGPTRTGIRIAARQEDYLTKPDSPPPGAPSVIQVQSRLSTSVPTAGRNSAAPNSGVSGSTSAAQSAGSRKYIATSSRR